MMYKIIILSVLSVILLRGIFFLEKHISPRITDVPEQIFEQDTTTPEDLEGAPAITTYVSGRRTIWAMDFLPNGQMVFTERGGNVNVVAPDGQVEEILNVRVHATGESGLHGIAVDPDFSENRFIYLYYTYKDAGSNTLNRVSAMCSKTEY